MKNRKKEDKRDVEEKEQKQRRKSGQQENKGAREREGERKKQHVETPGGKDPDPEHIWNEAGEEDVPGLRPTVPA